MPDEFKCILRDIITDLNLEMLTYTKFNFEGIPKQQLDSLTKVLAKRKTQRIYLAQNNHLVEFGYCEFPNYAELGLIAVDVPFIKENTLYMGNVGVRTDWYDSFTGSKNNNFEMSKMFDRIKARLVKLCDTGVIAKNKITNDEVISKSIQATSNAKKFYFSGGKLSQEGVANIEFIFRKQMP